eukprot:TRINITY_DN7433_c0_g1_i1.p1 TRINITY_DN7433_c0_g1~~TRINITY_DN7433_c0_g1_i1.p1  ORF type:complete len:1175 (+),score=340.25 TRINITY_DN7433_c0_g1_i1:83-3526(+)
MATRRPAGSPKTAAPPPAPFPAKIPAPHVPPPSLGGGGWFGEAPPPLPAPPSRSGAAPAAPPSPPLAPSAKRQPQGLRTKGAVPRTLRPPPLPDQSTAPPASVGGTTPASGSGVWYAVPPPPALHDPPEAPLRGEPTVWYPIDPSSAGGSPARILGSPKRAAPPGSGRAAAASASGRAGAPAAGALGGSPLRPAPPHPGSGSYPPPATPLQHSLVAPVSPSRAPVQPGESPALLASGSVRRDSPIRGSPKRQFPAPPGSAAIPSATVKRPHHPEGASVQGAPPPFLASQWQSRAEDPGRVTGVLDVVTMSLANVDPSYHLELAECARKDVAALFAFPVEQVAVSIRPDMRLQYRLSMQRAGQAAGVAEHGAAELRRGRGRLPALERRYREVTGRDVAAVINLSSSEGPCLGNCPQPAAAPQPAAPPAAPAAPPTPPPPEQPLPALPPPLPVQAAAAGQPSPPHSPAPPLLLVPAAAARLSPPRRDAPAPGRQAAAGAGRRCGARARERRLSSTAAPRAVPDLAALALPSPVAAPAGDLRAEVAAAEARLGCAVADGDCAAQAAALGELGVLHQRGGDLRQTIRFFARQVDVLERLCAAPLSGRAARADLARACSQLGNAHWAAGGFEEATRLHRRRLEIAAELGDQAGMGAALGNLGNVAHATADYDRAREYHTRHRGLVADGDLPTLCAVSHNLGLAQLGLGDYDRALDSFRHSLEIALSLGDAAQVSRAHGNLAVAFKAKGMLQEAATELHMELRSEAAAGDSAGGAATCYNLGNIYAGCSEHQTAAEYFRRGEQMATAAVEGGHEPSRRMLCSLLVAAASTATALGSCDQASAALDRAFGIASELGCGELLAAVHSQLGLTEHARGHHASAAKHHRAHLELAQRGGDPAGEAAAHGNLGNALLAMGGGHLQEAIDHFEADLCIAVSRNDYLAQSQACGGLGRAAAQLGADALALEYHRRAAAAARRGGSQAAEAEALGHAGAALEAAGDHRTAAAHHRRRWELARDLGDSAGQLAALDALARAHTACGELAAAAEMQHERQRLSRAVGNPKAEAGSAGHLSAIYQALGQGPEADKQLHRHRALCAEHGISSIDDPAAGTALNQIQLEVAQAMRGGARGEQEATGAESRLSRLAAQTLQLVQAGA